MSNKLSLYQIEDDLAALLNTVDLVEGEADLAAIMADIADETALAVRKRDGTIRFMRHLDSQQDFADAEIARLKALKETYATTQEKLAQYVLDLIDKHVEFPVDKKGKQGVRKLEGSIGVLRSVKKPDSVVITDEAAVPEDYKTVTLTMPVSLWTEILTHASASADAGSCLNWTHVDKVNAERKNVISKTAVKTAIDAGEDVPGADLKINQYRLEIK